MMVRTLRIAVGVVFAVGGVGCTKASAGSSSSTGGVGSSSVGRSSGVAAGSASGGTSAGTGTSSGSSSGGVGTTGSSTGSPFVDGGYVYCSVPNGDGGVARWMCQPGTYFCDLSGNPGNCFQCRSDADCADQSLPTCDPLRPRCDLDSGIAGYQGFCQQCLQNADCAGSSSGSLCDTNPTYPPHALEPPIEALGFETCGQIQTDCRQEGGPLCSVSNQVCDPFNGQCEARSTNCNTDADCAGLLTPPSGNPETGSPYLLRPYCVNGICSACAGGVCPHVCTSNSQCTGFWPVCMGLGAGNLDDAGQPIGICSCDSDADCGDGGLACLPPFASGPTIFGAQAGSNFCGVPCTSPDFPSCAALTGLDICYIPAGVCDGCGTDEQCVSSLGAGGPFCDSNLPCVSQGDCGCILDADCPAGDSCLSEGSHSTCLGICTPSFSRCTPESCGEGWFCNWDSGACVNLADILSFPSCVNDADCAAPLPVCVEGTCVDGGPERDGGLGQQCSSPADCPDEQGCDSQSHTCGTCRGPTAAGGPFDCPPASVCSNYWLGTVGACLPNCDRESCPADRPICAALPSLTPDHKYCFGCLQDVDCGDAGAWCDQSFKRTFTCQPAG